MILDRTLSIVTATVMLMAGMTTAYATQSTQIGHMTAAQKKYIITYFRDHSFGYLPIFKRYHRGSNWILKHQHALHLTSTQIKEEGQLKHQMIVDTIAAEHTLQAAYKQYARDAMLAHPVENTLRIDVMRVGRAQTHLAWVMAPDYFKGYTLLTPAQKALCPPLVAETWEHDEHAH
ncbi:MAG: hypothetical protein ACYCXG_07490 [Acidiferrobacter sp.]